MSRRILHIQSGRPSQTVESQIRRLAQQNTDAPDSPEQKAAQAFGHEADHFVVLDRVAKQHSQLQSKLAKPDRPGIAWPSDEILNDRSAAIHLMQMIPIVFLTIQQALRFTGGNRPRAAVEWLKKHGVTNVIVSDGVTCFGCFDECQELHPLLVRHHDDPQRRVDTFFGSLAWALANDIRWTEATKMAQACAAVDVPFEVPAEEYSQVQTVNVSRNGRKVRARVVVLAVSLLIGLGMFGLTMLAPLA